MEIFTSAPPISRGEACGSLPLAGTFGSLSMCAGQPGQFHCCQYDPYWQSQSIETRGIPVLRLLAELSDYARSIQASTPCSPGHWNCNGCDRYDSLDKAVKTPCTEIKTVCMGAHWEKARKPARAQKATCGVLPLRPEGTCSSPAWRTWDRHYGIGTHLRADGLLRPIQKYNALVLPGLLPPMWSFTLLGFGPERGLEVSYFGPHGPCHGCLD